MQKKQKQIMARFLCMSMMVVLCVMTTGCLRLVAEVGQGMFAWGGHHRSILVTKNYFDGTRSIAPAVLSPAAPIVLIDLPLEFAWDAILFPAQVAWRVSDHFKEQRRLADRTLYQVISDGDLLEAMRRLRRRGDHYDSNILYALSWKDNAEKEQFLPLIDAVFRDDMRFVEQAFFDRYLLVGDNLELYRYLFEKRLISPLAFPREYAVYNVVNTLCSNYVESMPRHIDLLRLLLEKGCNPNSVPYPNERYPEPSYVAFSALDFANSSYQYGREENRMFFGECIDLLQFYGARTGKELRLYYDLYWATLVDFFHKNDIDRFKERLEVADQNEKESAMREILMKNDGTYMTSWEWKKFLEVLREDGVPYPAKLPNATTFPVPRARRMQN